MFPMENEELQPAAPKVTVLIVSYNCADALRRCLAAIERSQARETIEVLVVDNGSGDECPRLDTEFPRITILRLPRYFGLPKARNIGIRTAAADLIFFLQPEIEVEPDTVPLLVDALEREPDVWAAAPLLSPTPL